MPRKNTKEPVEEKVEEVVIEKLKRGRKPKKVREPVATTDPVEESTPAPVSKKRVRKKKVSEEAPVVIEEVKEEVKPKKKPRTLKVEKSSEPKRKTPSKWMLHVQEFRKNNPDLKYSDVLKQAKQTYTK